MVRYSHFLVEDESGDQFWGVYEHLTEQFVSFYYFEDDAEEYAWFLENGGAFDGITPAFMLNEVEVNHDLDYEMEAFLEENFQLA